MKVYEKVVTTLIAIVLCAGSVFYMYNYGLHVTVGDYSVLTVYSTLATDLQNPEWVDDTVDNWEESNSVLSKFYDYVTERSDVSPVNEILIGRGVYAVCTLTALASLPLFLVSVAVGVGKQYRKGSKS